MASRPPRVLVAVSIAMLVLRLVWVWRFREIDSDAYGHFFIALATRRNPGNILVHWVWLPLYHFLEAGLTLLGAGMRGVRWMNALLATLGPFLLWDALRRRDERLATVTACAFALAPLTNILGQSAQPETLFLVFIVASMHAAAREWPIRAGVWLALACMIRYEAWGAAFALAVLWLVDRRRIAFVHVATPCAVVALYILFRWWTDHTLLLFFRGTRDITKVQTASTWTFRALVDFPIILPCTLLGPAVLLLPFGARRLTAVERTMAIGFGAFLLLSYYAGGSHSGARYLISLTPFAYAAIGFGARKRIFELLAPVSIALVTCWHLQRNARDAIDWDEGLRAREAELYRVL